MKLLVVACCLALATTSRAADILESLVRVLGEASDPQVQLDVLRGLRDATQGRSRLPMPGGWDDVEQRLARSPHPEVRSLSRTLGLTFGSNTALAALREILRDASADPGQRQDALRSLLAIRDPELPATLRGLLGQPAMRAAAIRALATFDDPEIAPAILGIYAQLTGTERRDALNTLAARPESARRLLTAVEQGDVPSRDLTADVIRQLRGLRDDGVIELLARVYGTIREVEADKAAEIERYKRLYWAGGSTPGDAIRGRAVYARVCQQCHTLFDVGGKVGPDLTGSNRGDLDYILQNILDPNAVIPNEYLASTIDLSDGRVVTGIIQEQNDQTITVATANETLTIPRSEIEDMQRSQLSMMPEGLLAPLEDQEVRDLIYYLSRPGQAPMLATPDTIPLLFNGRDLDLWHGSDESWAVDSGEIVGRAPQPLDQPSFLSGDMILGDFVFTAEVKVTPASRAAAVWFRAEPGQTPAGYRVRLGGDAWGSLEDHGGRGPLAPAVAPNVRANDWNTLEIQARGSSLRISLNGQPCVTLEDSAGARQGILAFELSAGPPMELRVRNPRIELAPGKATALAPR